MDGTAASSALANWRRRRASFVRRIRRKPFRGAEHVRAGEETGARFGRKSRRTRTRRGRAGIDRGGTGAIHTDIQPTRHIS